jgi:hypothetical protein
MAVNRTRRFLTGAALGLLLLIVALGGRAAGTLLFVFFAASLPVAVAAHRRRRRSSGRARAARRGPAFRTPAQIALAVFAVAGGGALAVVVVSLLLAVAAPPVVGDGSRLVRLLLVAFVLGPCVSLGRRCGRWWAFVGAAGLLPLLAFAMLVDGAVSSGSGLSSLAVLGVACALALGSLQSEWEARAAAPVARRRAGFRQQADEIPASRRSRSAVG